MAACFVMSTPDPPTGRYDDRQYRVRVAWANAPVRPLIFTTVYARQNGVRSHLHAVQLALVDLCRSSPGAGDIHGDFTVEVVLLPEDNS